MLFSTGKRQLFWPGYISIILAKVLVIEMRDWSCQIKITCNLGWLTTLVSTTLQPKKGAALLWW